MTLRTNVSWSLSKASSYELTLFWTEHNHHSSRIEARRVIVHSIDSPWEPWQIAGVVKALEAGAPIAEVVAAGDGPKLRRSLLARFGLWVGDLLLDTADKITVARPFGHRS